MKNRLYTPGPTAVPPEVLRALGGEALHHRTDEFRALSEEVLDGLRYVFRTQREVLVLTSSGTGALEAAVAGLFRRGEKVAVVAAGKFGVRWGEIARAYALDTAVFDVEWGNAADPDAFGAWLEKQGEVKGVLLTHCETSTGTLHDVRRLAEEARKIGALTIVDGITSVGVHELLPDRWGIDVVVGGSQKAFMSPPGLAFLTLSGSAWSAAERSDLPKYYFSLLKARESAKKGSTPFTPAVPLYAGLRAALARIRSEGLEAVIARHGKLARMVRAGVEAIGLELFSRVPADGLTAVRAPEGIDVGRLRTLLAERHGIRIAGGQERLKGKIFRIGHMGYYDEADIYAVLGALESMLHSLGHRFTAGAAVAAARKNEEE